MNWYQQLKSVFLNQVIAVTRVGVAADLATQHLVNVFTISGGDVDVLGVIGKIIATKDATGQTIELGFTPTGGARGVFAAASATTTGDVINKYYTWNGIIGSALIVAQTGDVIGFGAVNSALAGTSTAHNVFCPGVIDITTAAANDVLGLINWTIFYRPLSTASKITAL